MCSSIIWHLAERKYLIWENHYEMKKNIFLVLFLILSLSCFSQKRYISEMTKKIVFTRDGGKCNCCSSAVNLEYDHITPFSCGGSSDASNIQLLCMPCNRSKSNSCTCKIHSRKVGTNCCDGKSLKTSTSKSNSTSKSSSNSTVQCSGYTKKGNRCKNNTTNSNGRCHLH